MEIVQITFDVNIGSPSRPTGGVINTQPGRVKLFAQVIHGANPGAICRAQGQRRAPVFVDNCPGNERWMIETAPDHLTQNSLRSLLDRIVKVQDIWMNGGLGVKSSP